jgi:PPP family 3-phenylpropionic acid transporter
VLTEGGDCPEAHGAAERWKYAGPSVSAGYFWFFAAIGAFGPFATLYYRDLGFSGVEVGLLAALPAIALALSGPLWGAAADSLAAHRLVLRAAFALATLLVLAASQVSTFAAVLALIALFAFASAPISPFLDGYAVAISDRLGTSYGRLRVWGSIGYSAAVLLVGRLMGDRVDRTFFVAHAVCLSLALFASAGLPRIGERQARPLLGGLRQLGRNRPLAALLATSFLVSTSAAAMNSFLGIRLEELGGSASLVGAAIAIGAASELPIVAFGGWFLGRLGASRLITLAIAVYAIRLLAYGSITTPEWVLPVQTLHGLSYGAFLIASVTLVHRLAGSEHAATAQGLLGAVSFGMGSIAGSLLGGALLDAVGTAWLFRGAAILMLLTLVAFLFVERKVGIGNRDPAPIQSAQSKRVPNPSR